jgi:hypothetical protein
MAGLLDFIGTPEGQGLLSAAFGGLAGARRGAPLNSLGNAGLAGLGGYSAAIDRQNELARFAQTNQLAALQLKQAQQAADDQDRMRQLARDSFQTPEQAAVSLPGGPTNANAALTTSMPGGFNVEKYRNGLYGINPITAVNFAMQQNAMRPKVKEVLQGMDPTTNKPMYFSVNEYGDRQPLNLAPKPSVKILNLGGKQVAYDENNLASGTTFDNSADPNSVLSSNTSIRNNEATIKKDLQVAGYQPDGSPSGDLETVAQAIAAGQLPAPTGMAAANPRNHQLMGEVMRLNPEYDFAAVNAKKNAQVAFTTGPLGNSMRSFATAGQHLDQLNELVDALGNKNLTAINLANNKVKEWTGGTSVSNFNAAKDVVSKEVVKAIVAGGGGVSEREELARLMDSAKSPAQLKGVITQFRNLMTAQHENLLLQRRAAGLSDATLPDYSKMPSNAKPPIPNSIDDLVEQYRSNAQ